MLANLRGAISFLVFGLNTLLWCSLIFVFAFVRLIVPGAKAWSSKMMVGIAENWISGNSLNIALAGEILFDVRGLESLSG